MVVPRNAKNQMIGGNLLSSTSGATRKPARSYASMMDEVSALRRTTGAIAGLRQEFAAENNRQSRQKQASSQLNPDDFGHVYDGAIEKFDASQNLQGADPAVARQQMQMQNFRMSPGGAQMADRFQQLAARPAGPFGIGMAARMKEQQYNQDQQRSQQYNQNSYNMGSRVFDGSGELQNIRRSGANGLLYKDTGDGRVALTGMPTTPEVQASRKMADSQNRQMRTQERGGLSQRDAATLSRIDKRVASGRISKEVGAAQLRELQGRGRGLLQNDRVQSVIDRMEGKRSTNQAGQSGQSNIPSVKTPLAINKVADEAIANFQSKETLQAFGVAPGQDWSSYSKRISEIINSGQDLDVDTLIDVQDQLKKDVFVNDTGKDFFATDEFSDGPEIDSARRLKDLASANGADEIKEWWNSLKDARKNPKPKIKSDDGKNEFWGFRRGITRR